MESQLLPLLDGTRDRRALLEALLTIDRAESLRIEHDGKPVSGEAERRDALAEHIDALPQRLAEMMLS